MRRNTPRKPDPLDDYFNTVLEKLMASNPEVKQAVVMWNHGPAAEASVKIQEQLDGIDQNKDT